MRRPFAGGVRRSPVDQAIRTHAAGHGPPWRSAPHDPARRLDQSLGPARNARSSGPGPARHPHRESARAAQSAGPRRAGSRPRENRFSVGEAFGGTTKEERRACPETAFARLPQLGGGRAPGLRSGLESDASPERLLAPPAEGMATFGVAARFERDHAALQDDDVVQLLPE